jgi:hypothetical protein
MVCQASSAYDKAHHDRLNAASFAWAEQFSTSYEAEHLDGKGPEIDQEDDPTAMFDHDHELPAAGMSAEPLDEPSETLPEATTSKRRLPEASTEDKPKHSKGTKAKVSKPNRKGPKASDIGKDCAIAYLRGSDATSREGILQFEIAWDNYSSDTPWWQVLESEVAKGALSQDPRPYCGKLAEIEYAWEGETQTRYAVFKELSEDGNSWLLECGNGSPILAQLHLNKVVFDYTVAGDLPLTTIQSWKLLEDTPVGMTDGALNWNSNPGLARIRSAWDRTSFPRYEDAKVNSPMCVPPLVCATLRIILAGGCSRRAKPASIQP